MDKYRVVCIVKEGFLKRNPNIEIIEFGKVE